MKNNDNIIMYDGDFKDREGNYYVPKWTIEALNKGILYFDGPELMLENIKVEPGDYLMFNGEDKIDLLKEIETIQHYNKLNNVYLLEKDHSNYLIVPAINTNWLFNQLIPFQSQIIQFQKGPRNNSESTYGATNEDLLEIVRDRLIFFQEGKFNCKENSDAIFFIESALLALKSRTDDRAKRKVLGTYES